MSAPSSRSGHDDAIEVLQEVIGILGRRATTHGDAIRQNEDVARRWSEYLGFGIDAFDVCNMMCELKKSRLAHGGFDRDHVLDQIGYLAIGLASRPPERLQVVGDATQ